MAETKFAICTRASLVVGCKSIASFDDGTTEATACGEVYDARVLELLTEHDWRFAEHMVEMGHLAEAPEARWTHAWQLPSDYLKLLSLTVAGALLTEFVVNKDQVHCDVDEDQVLVLEYLRRVAESYFPPYFSAVLEERLASDLAGAVREDAQMAAFHRGEAAKKLMTAKRLDRLNNPPKKVPARRLVNARR